MAVSAMPDGGFVVTAVLPNSPASDAGIARGDRLVSVDDQPVAGLKLADVIGKLRGEAGEAVSVNLTRGNAPDQTYRLTRQAVGAGAEGGTLTPAATASGEWWK